MSPGTEPQAFLVVDC